MKRLTKPRFIFVYPLAIALFLFGRTTELQFRLGVLLVCCGEMLRLWANGYVGQVKVNWTQKNRGEAKIGRLVTAGPYAFVRHPLYLGTFIIGAGFCTMMGNWWLSLLAMIFFLFIYGAKMRTENHLLLHECGEQYSTYAAKVPQWIPRFNRHPNPQGRWTWQGILASKELKTVVWVTVCLLVVYFREEYFQEHELFGPKVWGKHLVLTVFLLLLIASDGTFELWRRLRRQQTEAMA